MERWMDNSKTKHSTSSPACSHKKVEREHSGLNFSFYVKRLKRGQEEVHTHIHALPNCSPKGQWDLDRLMQMVHRKKNCKQTLKHIC